MSTRIAMSILVFFWQAVYANTATISAGWTLQQTINYILLAQIFCPAGRPRPDLRVRLHICARAASPIALLRPLDFQGGYYVQNSLPTLCTSLVLQLPLAVVAWLVFGLQLPARPGGCGQLSCRPCAGTRGPVLLRLDAACLAFYTTETWGLGVLRVRAGAVLQRRPGAAGDDARLAADPSPLALPFAQALAVPLSLLTGISPSAGRADRG